MDRNSLTQHAFIHIINEPDADGVNQDCDSGYPTLTLWDPAGVVRVDEAAMSKIDTGDYTYEPELTTGRPTGSWPWRATLVTDSKKSFRYGSIEVL